MSKITLSFMQRFMVNLDRAIKEYVSSRISHIDTDIGEIVDDKMEDIVEGINDSIDEVARVKQDKPTVKTQTMAVGETTVTFTDLPTTGTNTFDFYTSKAGLNFTDIDDSTVGSLTLTYPEQEEAITVYLVIEGYSA